MMLGLLIYFSALFGLYGFLLVTASILCLVLICSFVQTDEMVIDIIIVLNKHYLLTCMGHRTFETTFFGILYICIYVDYIVICI